MPKETLVLWLFTAVVVIQLIYLYIYWQNSKKFRALHKEHRPMDVIGQVEQTALRKKVESFYDEDKPKATKGLGNAKHH